MLVAQAGVGQQGGEGASGKRAHPGLGGRITLEAHPRVGQVVFVGAQQVGQA